MDNKNVRQPLSKFQLNNEIKTSFEIGQVVPFFWRDTVPGDIFRNNTNLSIRFMPLIAPVMHKLDIHAHYYFVPYRLLDKNYRDIVSKPESPLVSKSLYDLGITPSKEILHEDNLLRAFGIHSKDGKLPHEAQKLCSQYFLRAYHLIYNYFYRHELLDDDYIDDMTSDDLDKMGLKLLEIGKARHGFDYFMSNLPTTQYGTMVELDMDGNGHIRVDEMRLAEKLQYFKERLLTRARGRYKNFLQEFFGVSPTNLELQQPLYLGGNSQMLQVSDIDQTASYEIDKVVSPLGSQAGKINNDRYGFNFKYKAEEHGIILGLCYVLPRASYIGGVPREFIKPDFYSFYNPTFAHLGMQETFGMELSADRKDTFGYNERYAELKYSKDVIAGDFAKLSSWHFGIDLRNEQLSKDFVHVNTDNQPFAVKSYKDRPDIDFRGDFEFTTLRSKDGNEIFQFFMNDFTSDMEIIYNFVTEAFPTIFPKKRYQLYDDFVEEWDKVKGYLGTSAMSNTSYQWYPYDGDDFFEKADVVLFNEQALQYWDKQVQFQGYDQFRDRGLSFLYAVRVNNVDLPNHYRAYNFDNNLYGNSVEIVPVDFENALITYTDVVGFNHILMLAYNNCDALRPIPKIAKPSISL